MIKGKHAVFARETGKRERNEVNITTSWFLSLITFTGCDMDKEYKIISTVKAISAAVEVFTVVDLTIDRLNFLL